MTRCKERRRVYQLLLEAREELTYEQHDFGAQFSALQLIFHL
jgi:hypothetical protein